MENLLPSELHASVVPLPLVRLTVFILIGMLCYQSCSQISPFAFFLSLKVYFDYMRSWIQMLQQLLQASHSLKNLLEEEWNFTKEITHYIRGGEAQAGKLFW